MSEISFDLAVDRVERVLLAAGADGNATVRDGAKIQKGGGNYRPKASFSLSPAHLVPKSGIKASLVPNPSGRLPSRQSNSHSLSFDCLKAYDP